MSPERSPGDSISGISITAGVSVKISGVRLFSGILEGGEVPIGAIVIVGTITSMTVLGFGEGTVVELSGIIWTGTL